MGGLPPSSMGDMPPLRQTHPTTQSQQPRQQATPYTPAVDVPRRVAFASKTSTPLGAPSYYSEAVKTSASTSGQPQGHSTERTTPSSSGSSRPQDQYWKLHLKSWHRRGPERSLTIGDTPIEAVPKDQTLYSSLGWTRDVTHLMNWFLYNEGKDLSAERRAQIILRALAYMSQHMEVVVRTRMTTTVVHDLPHRGDKEGGWTNSHHDEEVHLWIKPGSFYHLRVYQLKELKKCPHLVNLDPPKPDLEAPSMTSLRTHETTFEAARKNPQITQEAFEKARDKYADALKLHGCHATSATVRAMAPPKRAAYHWQWRCPTIWIGTSEVTKSSSLEATSHMEEEDDPDQTTPMEVYPSHTGETTRCSWSNRVDDKETWGQQSFQVP